MPALRYLSEAKLIELRNNIRLNLDRYTHGDFLDLETENGWAVESETVQVDEGALLVLDGTKRTAEADAAHSIIVYKALEGMTPALAREERVWARLTHVECLNYSRTRWLAGLQGDPLLSAVNSHMFARGLQGVRDDNALSRLWWNMHIATLADSNDPEGALKLIVKSADFRKSFVERSGTASRRPLARAIVRAMRRDPWIVSSEDAFRRFMSRVNRDSGGVLFEVLPELEVDLIIQNCAHRARTTS